MPSTSLPVVYGVKLAQSKIYFMEKKFLNGAGVVLLNYVYMRTWMVYFGVGAADVLRHSCLGTRVGAGTTGLCFTDVTMNVGTSNASAQWVSE